MIEFAKPKRSQYISTAIGKSAKIEEVPGLEHYSNQAHANVLEVV